MNRPERSLWAKKQDKSGQYEWLPLTQHLDDTLCIAGLLWEHWLADGQKQLVLDLFSAEDRDREEKAKGLVQFIAAVHDLGKATPAFQIKRGHSNVADLDAQLLEKLEQQGYQNLSSMLFSSIDKSPHALAGQYLLTMHGIRNDIASVVGAHHGKPVDTAGVVENQAGYDSNYYQEEDSAHPTHQKWQEAQKNLIARALEASGFDSIDALPAIPQSVQVLLSGVLIMADWIASNEQYFPLIGIQEENIADAEKRLEKAWSGWKKSDRWQPKVDGKIAEQYERRFGFSPRTVQEGLSAAVHEAESPGLFILEAPMGIGKTEAALLAAEQLAQKTGRSGLFFGLPTQATSNGIFPRITTWLNAVEKEAGETASLRLAHGKAALNKEFAALAANINTDEEMHAAVIVNEWFAGRKTTALDDFVVGTVDQFLLTALKQKHLALRHLGFSKKVIVIDEVHAYDAYMSQYLLRAIQWMGSYGVPVIILSATLPAKRRADMVKYYLLGRGLRFSQVKKRIQNLYTDAYPLITYTDGDQVVQKSDFPKDPAPKEVRIVRQDSDALQALLDTLTESEGVIGIMVNTVKTAQEMARTYAARYGAESVFLLHSNFIATDRAEKEAELLQMIGKNAKRPKQKIIIGTQVIEQSLDIDLDVLITELAPMDLLIQRIGRLHRHPITRPKAHAEPVCYVLHTNDDLVFDKGSSFVYGDYLLTRTQAFLPEVILLPDDISPLVQQVYADDTEEPVRLQEPWRKRYEEMKTEQEVGREKSEEKAMQYRIAPPSGEETLIGWLSNDTSNESEEQAYAQVRDTKETIEVIALRRIDSGYGLMDGDENLSQRIHEPGVAKAMAQQTLRLPLQLSAPWQIESTLCELEKIHSKHFSSWDTQHWLKGALGILFDKDGQTELNGFLLRYDKTYGLSTERK